jgi:hypothetical protein
MRIKQTTQINANKIQRARGMTRGTFVKTIAMMFTENKTDTTPYLQEMRGIPTTYVDYIVAAMSNSLDYQTAHANFFSSHRYEKQKLMENMMTQSFQTCKPW